MNVPIDTIANEVRNAAMTNLTLGRIILTKNGAIPEIGKHY
jgi:hypothetical protein